MGDPCMHRWHEGEGRGAVRDRSRGVSGGSRCDTLKRDMAIGTNAHATYDTR